MIDKIAFANHMSESLLPTFATSVIPIWSSQFDLPVQVGTGTLLRVDDKRFLITAEHVTALASKHGFQLYISDGVPGAPNIPLEGRLDRTVQYDVAV